MCVCMREARTVYNGEPGMELVQPRKRHKMRAATCCTTYLSQIHEDISRRHSPIPVHAAGQIVKIRATKNRSPSMEPATSSQPKLD